MRQLLGSDQALADLTVAGAEGFMLVAAHHGSTSQRKWRPMRNGLFHGPLTQLNPSHQPRCPERFSFWAKHLPQIARIDRARCAAIQIFVASKGGVGTIQ
jgi:hypothetical protein